MYVDALSEGSRTRVRFPPPPPYFALNCERNEVCRAEAVWAKAGYCIRHFEAPYRHSMKGLIKFG